MIDPDKYFKKHTTCFDGYDWVMQRIRSSDLQFSASSLKKTQLSIIPESLLEELELTDEEKSNVPALNWLYGTHGKNVINFGESDQVYILFTYDSLKLLGYYSEESKHPQRTMDAFPIKADKIYLADYKDVFGKGFLKNGGRVCNPLNYRPSGDKVLVVEETHVTTALGRCTSPKAKALVSLMSRFFNVLLKINARRKVAEIGAEAFKERVSGPADHDLMMDMLKMKDKIINLQFKAMGAENEIAIAKKETAEARTETVKAIAQAKIAEARTEMTEAIAQRKVAEARTETAIAQKETAIAQKETAIAQKEMAEERFSHLKHKIFNKPIRPHFNTDEHPRIGCVGIFCTSENYLRMRFTEDTTTKRPTLKQSAERLKGGEGETMIAGLYGGINVFRVQTVMDQVFGHKKNEFNDIVTQFKKKFFPALESSFAIGFFCDGGCKRIWIRFYNDIVVNSLPDEDREFCEAVKARKEKNIPMV